MMSYVLCGLAFALFSLYATGVDIRIRSWFQLRAIKREGDRRVAAFLIKRAANLHLVALKRLDDGTAVVTVDYFGKRDEWHGAGDRWRRSGNELSRASDWMSEWLREQAERQQ